MSGGHFDYKQDHIRDVAEMVDELISSNDDTSLDAFGCQVGKDYSPKTIAKFKDASATIHRAAAMAQRIDWLVSGDDGEESFHRRWDEEVRS